ncbi:hypothetical protein [Streptomyces megasporus]|uniref:hypothetical protein n=1 Tax=Streptomyces megasporus TaxID=44060 RepID=UPI000A905527|nr:hypothetical protein [Streptomyces megasporus]
MTAFGPATTRAALDSGRFAHHKRKKGGHRRMHPTGTKQPTGTPIYDRLVRERGDIPADVRQVAETTLRSAARAVDFRRPRPPAR